MTAMRVQFSGAVPDRYRAELRELVDIGFRGVNGAGVELHVRTRPARVSYVVHYDVDVDELSPKARLRWLAQHPDTPRASVTHTVHRLGTAQQLASTYDGAVERRVDDRTGARMSGVAYYSLPSIARVAKTTKYLVTLKLPAALDALPYPFVGRYHRQGKVMTTAPAIEVRNWREEFVHLVAHEAYHAKQFRNDLRRSEVTAERWALRAVERYRAEVPEPLSQPASTMPMSESEEVQ